jgi:hypothetical protein
VTRQKGELSPAGKPVNTTLIIFVTSQSAFAATSLIEDEWIITKEQNAGEFCGKSVWANTLALWSDAAARMLPDGRRNFLIAYDSEFSIF